MKILRIYRQMNGPDELRAKIQNPDPQKSGVSLENPRKRGHLEAACVAIGWRCSCGPLLLKSPVIPLKSNRAEISLKLKHRVFFRFIFFSNFHYNSQVFLFWRRFVRKRSHCNSR